MTSQKEKKQMLDYLVCRLNGSNPKINPVKKELVSGIKSNYILVGDDGAVILADQTYPNGSFGELYSIIRNSLQSENKKVTAVFYKDGETFFKNAAESHGFKQKYELSLKKYTPEQIHRMISLKKGEIFMNEKKDYLQYYQPKSEKLNEGLVTYQFKQVEFDYSHLSEEELQRLREHDRLDDMSSKRIFLQEKKAERDCPLELALIKSSDTYPITKPNPYYIRKKR